jgi:hypothetical protein
MIKIIWRSSLDNWKTGNPGCIRQKVGEQNKDLQECYFYNLSEFRSYHLVYIDESGCDGRVSFWRTSWSPLGTTVSKFHRDQR